MANDDGVADLHMHTVASDGTCSVADRIEQATRRGLEAIAITDHDRLPADLDGRFAFHGDLEVVTGVEIRADLFDTKIELLGYYVDPTDEDLRSLLEGAREFRHDRNRELVERLDDLTALDLDYDELRSEVDGNVGRPHLADRLVEGGVVDSVGAAFDEYLAEGGRAFAPMSRFPADEVIDAIHGAGGVASLAHPGRIRSDRVPEMVAELADVGLDGIEVRYPYDDEGPDAYADVGVEEAADLASRHDLVRTGGSDCHGPSSGKFRIGDVRVPADEFGRLRERAGVVGGDSQD